MSKTSTPLQFEAVGLGNVRFFRPPSGGREFPFVALNDLYIAMAIPCGARREFDHALRTGPWKENAKTVATADGVTTIVAHFVAQGLIDAMAEVGRCSPDFYRSYATAGAKALSKLTDGLHGDALLAYIKAARDSSEVSPSKGGRS